MRKRTDDRKPGRTKRRCILFLTLLASALLSCRSPALADQYHKVKKGETLSAIASQYGVSVSDIVRYNGMASADTISVGQQILVPPRKGIAQKYTVQRGDALSTIATKHGLSAKQLIAFNNLRNPDALSVGQVILIPAKGASSPSGPTYGEFDLPPSIRKQLQKVKVNRWKWKYIVLHHSATDRGSAKGMDRYHREERRMENGLAYHFVIGNGRGSGDGAIEIGNRWKRQIKGGHVASTALNEKSIGICLVGNFEKRKPTAAQVKSLQALLGYLKKRCHLKGSAVKAHRDINPRPTTCPGKHFPKSLI